MNLFETLLQRLSIHLRGKPPAALPGEENPHIRQRGTTLRPGEKWNRIYRQYWADTDLIATTREIREMDKQDGRVKKIHTDTASNVTKGGLVLDCPNDNTRLIRQWADFKTRLWLDNSEKLESHARQFMIQGNLPLQLVQDSADHVIDCVAMPAETVVPLTGANGRFNDPTQAYAQWDLDEGRKIAVFPLWQIVMPRLTPDNFDDFGSRGRPYLDTSRPVWNKLTYTEESMVKRRASRAAQRKAHLLKNMKPEAQAEYRERIENAIHEGEVEDYFVSGDGDVKAIEGDARLAEIDDVLHLLYTFYAGAPAPAGLMGYGDRLSRDVLEDLKQMYFDEIDRLQDILANAYQEIFRRALLLQGVNPASWEFKILFAERRTETPTQRTDRALKLQAIGASEHTVFRTAGLDPAAEMAKKEAEAAAGDPYPHGDISGTAAQRVSVTPGNRRKGESATDISLRSGR